MKLSRFFLNLMVIFGAIGTYRTDELTPNFVFCIGWIAGVATMMVLFDVLNTLH